MKSLGLRRSASIAIEKLSALSGMYLIRSSACHRVVGVTL